MPTTEIDTYLNPLSLHGALPIDAAFEDALERRKVALQLVYDIVAQRRHLAVLLRREAAEPGLAGVDGEGAAAGGGDLRHEGLQRLVAVLRVEIGRASCRERVCQYV